MMIRPPALQPRDKGAAVSLSTGWPAVFTQAYLDGKRQIEEAFAVEVVECKYTLASPEWLAAHPEARAADLMQAVLDPPSVSSSPPSVAMIPFAFYRTSILPRYEDIPRSSLDIPIAP
jgi:hypothetical protein